MNFDSQHVERVLAAVRTSDAPSSDGIPKISVHSAIRRFSFLYERIRNAVEYRDDHLLRKSAIHRILKRLLVLESDPDLLAEKLVRELVSAKYVPDSKVPESVLVEVAKRIRKFKAIVSVHAEEQKHLKWLRSVLAVEIEELLVDHREQKALTTFLFERLIGRVHVHGVDISETEERIQLYIACERALWKSDDDMLSYKLLRAYLPEWTQSDEWVGNPRPIAERLIALQMKIQKRLAHPLHRRFLRAVKPWSVSLLMLREVLQDEPEAGVELFEDEAALDRRISDKAEATYKKAAAKLRRGTVRAVIYLFLTKMVFALLVELPLEQIFLGHIQYFPLSVNLLFPPILMIFVGLLIRIPGRDNTDRIVEGVHALLSEPPIPVSEIRIRKSKKGTQRLAFTVIYLATFLITFGVTIMFLQMLDFTFISITIFLFFLCVVSFFGFRLRRNAREVVVVEPKQRTLSVIAEFFSLPILRAGHWLSRNMNRINVFLFIFDFLIEAPFKMFLAILEEWFAFMKEKKEELQ